MFVVIIETLAACLLLRGCGIPCRIQGFTIDKKLQKGAMPFPNANGYHSKTIAYSIFPEKLIWTPCTLIG